MKSSKTDVDRLIDNVVSLGILQIINYAIPLIIFPYLVHILGIAEFGLFSFITVVISYGVLLTEYGFELSATKHISIHKDEPKKISEIFSSVIIIKLLGFFIFLAILTPLILFVDKFYQNHIYYIVAIGSIIGQLLFPVWFFQGIEKMRYITILNAISKIISTILIFIFVKDSNDLIYVFIFNSIGSILAGGLAFYIAIHNFQIKFSWQSLDNIWFYMKDGWYIFISRVSVQLYQTANIIILGLMTNDIIVGYYALLYKIISSIGNIFGVITTATYPYFSNLYIKSKELFYRKSLFLSIFILAIMLPISILVYIYAADILRLISGDIPSSNLVELLKLFSVILVIILYGSQFTNMLVILDKTKLLNNIVIIAGIINITLIGILIHYFSIKGVIYLNIAIIFFIVTVKGYYVYIKFKREDCKSTKKLK